MSTPRALSRRTTRRRFLIDTAMWLGAASVPWPSRSAARTPDAPNILLILSDDQSWLHTSITGDPAVKTPAFDHIAHSGVLFTHAFAPAPSCGPCRAATLTGQDMWRLGEAANQGGPLTTEYTVYPDVLEGVGYSVGHIGKGWAPGSVADCGRERNPAGDFFGTPGAGDVVTHLWQFLATVPDDRPFCCWLGHYNPHRDYHFVPIPGHSVEGKDVAVPEIWPDVGDVHRDIAAYLTEIQEFDHDVSKIIDGLGTIGRLENTLIIVASDNGMPFPRAKATLYDLGTRVPLAMMWNGVIPPGRVVDDFVSLTDLAPTFVEIAGLPVPEEMTGKSLVPLLTSSRSGRIDQGRSQIVTARERHAPSRAGGVGYPSRAIRTHDHLYIRNFEPDRWPMGDPPLYGDVDSWDGSYIAPTKDYMIRHKDDPKIAPLFQLCFGKRPAEELYIVGSDPYQVRNVLPARGRHREIHRRLAAQLDDYLRATGDPRPLGTAIWDEVPSRVKSRMDTLDRTDDGD